MLIIIFFARGHKQQKDKKKMVDVHLFATNAQVVFWSNIFCNNFLTTFSTVVFQHCLLQHHFNIIFVAL
jgi:hypothetical protein